MPHRTDRIAVPVAAAAATRRRLAVLASSVLFFGAVSSRAATLEPGSLAAAQEPPIDGYTVFGGERVELDLAREWIALKEAPGVDAESLLLLAAEEPALFAPAAEWERLPVDVTLARCAPGLTRNAVRAAVARLRSDPTLAWAGPVYGYGRASEILTDSLFVGFERDLPAEARVALHAQIGADEVSPLAGFPGVYRVKLRVDDARGVLDVVDAYRRSPGVEFAEPEFYWRAGLSTPNDPYLVDQWGLENTGGYGGGRPGADMSVLDAWEFTEGDPSIVIAIVDEGVDMDHEDLAANIVAGFDTTDQSASPPGGVAGNASCNDGHGTACAGIAAAVANNGAGVAGVAPGCRLMSVRIGRGSVWTMNEWAANGINTAWQSGASVISNSWGGGSPSTLINTAVGNARSAGRGGKGCAVLFAAGNGNDPNVTYPANLGTAIAVGATSPCDERKSPTSCDGEYWWGSNYGSALDVVAPGVLVATTDIAGSCAYSGGDYIGTFNGTSAATPAAAGIAALILSCDATLTAAQVQDTLQETADDQVGNPSEDTPGRDNFMGYGRVDALRAVIAVLGQPSAPSVESIDPASGPQKGGTPVTINGSSFYGVTAVLFGGVAAGAVTRIDSTHVACVAPPFAALGPVDVTVIGAWGSGTRPGAFSYSENPVNLAVSGTVDQGSTLTLEMDGASGRAWGLVASDQAGPWTIRSLTFCFARSGSLFDVLHRPKDTKLDSFGIGSETFQIPPDFPALGNLFFQGVVQDASGAYVVSNCQIVTVF